MAIVWRPIDTWTIQQKQSKKNHENPVTTPTEIIQAETGIMDIESIRAQKQVLYYHRIMNTKGNDTLKMLLNTGKNPWTNIDQENSTRNEQKNTLKTY